MNKLGN